MKYTISIDFSTKSGYAIWKQEKEPILVTFSDFLFQDKSFKKQFKNTNFQQKIYEKTIFLQSKAKELITKIFSSNNFKQEDEISFVIEFSDFGFKYTIENLSRIFALLCVELNSYCINNKYKNISMQKILAVQWRSAFKRNNLTKYEWNKYEVDGKKIKKINWKVFALDWMKQFIKKDLPNEQRNLQFNDDVAEAILIGYTWIKYMNNESE